MEPESDNGVRSEDTCEITQEVPPLGERQQGRRVGPCVFALCRCKSALQCPWNGKVTVSMAAGCLFSTL
jgi:hypothetical protein